MDTACSMAHTLYHGMGYITYLNKSDIVTRILHGWYARSLERPCMMIAMLGCLTPPVRNKRIGSAIAGISEIRNYNACFVEGYVIWLAQRRTRAMECIKTDKKSPLLIASYSLVETHHTYVSANRWRIDWPMQYLSLLRRTPVFCSVVC